MDILMEAAYAYREICNRQYNITFSDGTSIAVAFKPSNFVHLSGLHKLVDLYWISSRQHSAKKIFRMVCSGGISYMEIQSSIHYDSSSRERLECICRLAELLKAGEKAVHKFNRRICRANVSFKADTIFFKDDGYDFFITFGAAPEADTSLHYPETIFYRFDEAYIQGQNIVTIQNVEIIRIGPVRKESA